jgi:hypothetical protein
LRLWAGFFVVETRPYFSQYCFVSTPRIQPKSAAHRRAGLLPQAAKEKVQPGKRARDPAAQAREYKRNEPSTEICGLNYLLLLNRSKG